MRGLCSLSDARAWLWVSIVIAASFPEFVEPPMCAARDCAKQSSKDDHNPNLMGRKRTIFVT